MPQTREVGIEDPKSLAIIMEQPRYTMSKTRQYTFMITLMFIGLLLWGPLGIVGGLFWYYIVFGIYPEIRLYLSFGKWIEDLRTTSS